MVIGERVQLKDAFDEASTAKKAVDKNLIKIKAACYHSINQKIMPIVGRVMRIVKGVASRETRRRHGLRCGTKAGERALADLHGLSHAALAGAWLSERFSALNRARKLAVVMFSSMPTP